MSTQTTPVRFGALSLLLLVVAIVLALLSVLALATANAASALTDRHVAYVSAVYALDTQGAEWLADTDATLQSAKTSGSSLASASSQLTKGASVSGDTVSVVLGDDDSLQLSIALKVNGAFSYKVESWNVTKEFPQDAAIGNLWRP